MQACGRVGRRGHGRRRGPGCVAGGVERGRDAAARAPQRGVHVRVAPVARPAGDGQQRRDGAPVEPGRRGGRLGRARRAQPRGRRALQGRGDAGLAQGGRDAGDGVVRRQGAHLEQDGRAAQHAGAPQGACLLAQVEQERHRAALRGRRPVGSGVGPVDGQRDAAVRVPQRANAGRGLAERQRLRQLLHRPHDPRLRGRQDAAAAYFRGTRARGERD
mmetsp:Transcript_17207/g.60473  ORF Transcript_17207/g.60473 Transcript_17207/m.60473 type:complete len:217 (+) Transcript_17207:290-940(+)